MSRRNRRRPGTGTPETPSTPIYAVGRKAVLYARVSSAEQAQEGFSIEAQRELLRSYAREQRFEVVAEYVDVETAKKAGRTAFGEMLEHVTRDQVKVILVEKTDRLYRNIRDWVTLDDMDLEIHLVKEGGVLCEGSRSHEKFIHGIKVLMAKNYIDNLGEETSKGMTQKARQGHWPSRAPIGYRNRRGPDGKNMIELDPERAPVVIELFETYATGQSSMLQLARLAAERGLVTARGKRLAKATVHYLLQNPLYMGQYSWNGEWFDGMHQPLVSTALWDRVQDILDGRSRTSARPARRMFAFTGLLRCGPCADEGVERLLSPELKKEQYVYYHCTRCKELGRVAYTAEHAIARRMLDQLRTLHMPPHVLALVAEALRRAVKDATESSERDRERLEAQAREVRRKLAMGYDDRLSGRLPAAIWTELSEDWQVELQAIQRRLAALGTADARVMDAGIALLELATMACESWTSMNDRERRELLGKLTSNSRLWIDRIEVSWRKPFDLLPQSPWALETTKATFADESGLGLKWLPSRSRRKYLELRRGSAVRDAATSTPGTEA